MEMGKPLIVIKDVELIKKVLIKDFDHFVYRRDFFSSQDKWIKKFLFVLKGDEWKGVRSAVSPTFTTGKIRRMMELFNFVGTECIKDLKEQASRSKERALKIDAMRTVNVYTIDVIASLVFGVSSGAIQNPNSTFAKNCYILNDITPVKIFKFALNLLVPCVLDLFKISLFDQKAVDFFQSMWADIYQFRMSGDAHRNDFLQLLVEAKKGKLKAVGRDELGIFEKDAEIRGQGLIDKQELLTDEVLCMVFFLAGFSATSNFISFTAYELAVHQDVHDRLRTEVGKVVRPDGTFDYDDLGGLLYLDMVINEVNRLFPGASRLERVCNKDYQDSETSLVIPKGALVAIPVDSLHRDKAYYHNPDAFDPEHFSPARNAARNPYVYMPFGVGPRNCIGTRFALIETKIAVAHLVHNFVIRPCNCENASTRYRKTSRVPNDSSKGLEAEVNPS